MRRESREKREQMRRRVKFSEEMRGERNKSEEISVDMVGSELKKLVFWRIAGELFYFFLFTTRYTAVYMTPGDGLKGRRVKE
jgi:hypothetical protein